MAPLRPPQRMIVCVCGCAALRMLHLRDVLLRRSFISQYLSALPKQRCLVWSFCVECPIRVRITLAVVQCCG